MPSPLRLFVSATPDLEPEREAIGQVVAALPISLGWEIGRTPRRGEPLQPSIAAVADCHLYLFLLGQDIAAPAGVEWDVARRSGRKPLAFLKDVLRTPAAQVFVREAEAPWSLFASARQLSEMVHAALVERLLAEALSYGLSIVEVEALAALRHANAGAREAIGPPAVAIPDGGAGGGGVILGPHSLPPGGVPLPIRD